MMNCEQALEAISARLDGALSEEENRELEAHLASCASCRDHNTDLLSLCNIACSMTVFTFFFDDLSCSTTFRTGLYILYHTKE